MLDRAAGTRTLTAYRPHRLHDPERPWPETNCYVDLWIEVLSQRGYDPTAALGFTLRQDFEGDHFTFFKFPLEDLEALFGISVQELAIFDDLERHTLEQLARGRLVLIEMDGFYLPDTDGVSYRLTHPKTTIGVTALDPAQRTLSYFHNAGHFSLSGADYDGVFRKTAALAGNPDILFPYVEFAKFDAARASRDIPAEALRLLRHHWRFRPRQNPVEAFRFRFQSDATNIAARGPDFFHAYAFNTLRQLGANFGLLAEHLDWLGGACALDFAPAIVQARAIETGAKSFQFQLARAVARSRMAGLDDQLKPLTEAYALLFAQLEQTLAT